MKQGEYFMEKALALAKKGLGKTNPNPMVGAVIVKNGKVLAEGYHRGLGRNHAEIEALARAGKKAKGATMYLNLEPCAHYGRTPPCVDAIIKAGIAKIVCATLDPNPKVNGKGAARLKRAGIKVSVELKSKEARDLNEPFFVYHEKKRPFVAIKFAASLDGKLATKTNDSKWITNEKARVFARKIRSEYQAVLVGINTVLRDDPHLGVRRKGKKDPLRVILDSQLRVPLDAKVLRDANVLIATTARASQKKKILLEKKGVAVLSFSTNLISVGDLLQTLGKREIVSVLVEGGGGVLGEFLDKKCVDKVYGFFAPIFIGGDKAITIRGKGINNITDASGLKKISVKRFNNNFLITGSFSA